jgi:hypothetical protein
MRNKMTRGALAAPAAGGLAAAGLAMAAPALAASVNVPCQVPALAYAIAHVPPATLGTYTGPANHSFRLGPFRGGLYRVVEAGAGAAGPSTAFRVLPFLR